MKIFKAAQVRDADLYTIENEPILSINLMERAAKRCTEKIIELFDSKNNIKIFAGPGNNGGDGLAIARLLSQKKYSVQVFILKFTGNFSEDFKTNRKRLENINNVCVNEIFNIADFPKINKNDIIIDAIFGSGLTRPLTGFVKNVVEKINSLHSKVIAIDIPSGLSGEQNDIKKQTIIQANYTLTFEFPFLSFFHPESEKFIGWFHIIPIGISKEYVKNTKSDFYYIEATDISSKIKKRTKFSHKGTFGHTLIIAGSYGMAGACIFASKAAQKSGVGLVTAVVPKCNYQILQIASPETMLIIDENEKFITKLPELEKYNSIAIGPGIGFGEETKDLLKKLIKKTDKPIIFDADAITILGNNKEWLNNVPINSIFTPHPKEFERIAGKWSFDYEKINLQIKFSKKYKSFVVLKGANTSITTPEGKCYFNSTGNPGMATGGSGDVLTGIIAAITAQDHSIEDALILAVYFHGKAGDNALQKMNESSITASDIINNLLI